jgi:hypothetical protein
MKFKLGSPRSTLAPYMLVTALLICAILPANVFDVWYLAPHVTVEQRGLSVSDSGSTNSGSGKPLRLLTLHNDGSVAVGRQQYYTVYWTNQSGNSTDSFVSLGASAVIRPGKSETVAIEYPLRIGKWHTSFGFNAEPGKGFREIQNSRLLSYFLPAHLSAKFDEAYIVLGPKIESSFGTNSISGASREPSP